VRVTFNELGVPIVRPDMDADQFHRGERGGMMKHRHRYLLLCRHARHNDGALVAVKGEDEGVGPAA
jgi:hypothetical protein